MVLEFRGPAVKMVGNLKKARPVSGGWSDGGELRIGGYE